MKLKGCPPLDMYIRTSGVKRFSDYMLWQVSLCCSLVVVPSRSAPSQASSLSKSWMKIHRYTSLRSIGLISGCGISFHFCLIINAKYGQVLLGLRSRALLQDDHVNSIMTKLRCWYIVISVKYAVRFYFIFEHRRPVLALSLFRLDAKRMDWLTTGSRWKH